MNVDTQIFYPPHCPLVFLNLSNFKPLLILEQAIFLSSTSLLTLSEFAGVIFIVESSEVTCMSKRHHLPVVFVELMAMADSMEAICWKSLEYS